MTSPTLAPSPTSSGLSQPVAVTLVRRGYRTPAEARAFLAADESHPPEAFEGMEEVAGLVLAAIEAGERITVHGDFDVDGVSATALMISTLRELGADCDWLIPDRIADGYGLGSENVEKLAERGTGLLITVDCGITAVEQVAPAQDLGMEVIVTDHHQRDEELPPCLILHPEVSATRSSRSAAPRSPGSSHARSAREAADGRTWTWWRWRRSPTWCR